MGRVKLYNTIEEAKEAIKQQRLNYINKIGCEKYRDMVNKASLKWYYNKQKAEGNDLPKKKGRPRTTVYKEEKIII